MNTLTLTLAKNRLVQLGIVGLIGMGVGYYLNHRLSPPTTTTTEIHGVQQVKVEAPVLTPKVVAQIITDPKQQAAIKLLMKENDELKLKVTQLQSTVAVNRTSGGTDSPTNPGTIVERSEDRQANTSTSSPGIPSSDPSYTFKDYQLEATYSRTNFRYDLTQTFIIESTTGKSSSGDPIGIVRLFQDTPTGLVNIPAKTTVIQADEAMPRWFLSPRIQGGLTIDQNKSKAGFVGLQLLKRGTSKDPKDLAFAVGTVGISLGNGPVEPTLIPFSVNVGHPKISPFSNVWVGPTINLKKTIGLAVVATF